MEPTGDKVARSDARSFDSGADIAPMPGQDAGERDFFDPEEYLGSFSALRDSMAQGRDLKKKRKALDEYKKTLDTLRKAYEDRVNIARNYDAMITDQEHIIAATNTDIQRATRAREDVERKIADANEELAELKRRQAREHSVVMDGRDIGTVVLPKATVKIFLTATPEVRAKRRTDELIAKGQKADYNKILKDIQQRDYQDTHREIAPLKMARDSVKLDTSELDIDGVIAAMKEIIARKVTL